MNNFDHIDFGVSGKIVPNLFFFHLNAMIIFYQVPI